MNKKISIIIPCYNSEKTIKRCIDSILCQTYSKFQLIIVNDGSQDKSCEICEYYAILDNRIKVINKSNGGVSSARNAGLEVADGEFITFIDSDDYVLEQYLEPKIRKQSQWQSQLQ